MNRILIAGTNSGCGKTSVTCALLYALMARGLDVASFKCGPDYIDPMFHRSVIGINAHNLDPYFCDAGMLRRLLLTHAGRDITVIEGVMGYYDGIACTEQASTYALARATRTPVVLVVNAKKMGNSAGAMLSGFVQYRPDSRIAGVIFNGVSSARYGEFAALAREVGIEPLGCLPYEDEIAIKSRHLGLVKADEMIDLEQKLKRLGALAQMYMDIDAILRLASEAEDVTGVLLPAWKKPARVRLAVALDEAFCFLYRENIEVLESFGCEIVYFSPMHDETLPANVGGLYLCGGYPELYVEALSNNRSMRKAICEQIEAGLPTIAECGGFLYLHKTIDQAPMAGVIPGHAKRTARLQRFGYVTLTAQRDNLLCEKGQSVRAHEFHYYESDCLGDGFVAHKAGRANSWPCIHASASLYAGFAHLYFYTNTKLIERFVEKAVSHAT